MSIRIATPLTSLTLLAAWLGAAVLVAAVLAPAAFAVLPTRALAGALVGRVLPSLFYAGIVIAVVDMVLLRDALRPALIAGLVALGGSCAIAQLVVARRIATIRESVGGALDALDPADPRRIAFGRLHGFSVMWMGLAGIGALIALFAIGRLLSSRTTA